MAKTTTTILQSSELVIGYGEPEKPLSKALNLQLYSGEIVCLLGPNGSGKSTLLRTLAGLQPALSGGVYIAERTISTIPRNELARLLSVVLTEKPAAGMLRVFDLVAIGRLPYTNFLGALSQEDQQIVQECLRQVHLEDFAERPFVELSDGEAQRVMIARALAQQTDVILLDEPTIHLDLPTRIEILSLLRNLGKQTGKAILLSTHELDLALQMADTIWLLDKKARFFSGIPEELVLDNSIQSVFERDGLSFDNLSGAFHMPVEEALADIHVSGEGIYYEWTKRALKRSGFRIVEEAVNDTKQVLISDEKWEVRINQKSIRTNSLKEMLLIIAKH
ncbi:MAG: ABC transporter ATP-binding protein [Calditrichia bacterium]